MFWLPIASCHQAMGLTAHALPFVSRQSNANGVFRSPLFQWVLVSWEVPSCFPSGLLLYQSLVVFLDHWYPCFRNFDSVILVDVIRVKPSVDNFLDSSSSKQSIRHDQHLKWLHSETSNETVYYTYLPPGWAITSFTVSILKLFLMLASMKHVALCRLTNCSLFFSWTVRMQVTADVYFTFVFLYVLLYSRFLFNIR